jgi:hypothetical protein
MLQAQIQQLCKQTPKLDEHGHWRRSDVVAIESVFLFLKQKIKYSFVTTNKSNFKNRIRPIPPIFTQAHRICGILLVT